MSDRSIASFLTEEALLSRINNTKAPRRRSDGRAALFAAACFFIATVVVGICNPPLFSFTAVSSPQIPATSIAAARADPAAYSRRSSAAARSASSRVASGSSRA